MKDSELLMKVIAKAQTWLTGNYDEVTKNEIRRMIDADDKTELIECFYRDLEFGTGGLRGIMGAGTNRMNIYTVGAATQGLSNYLKAQFPNVPQISVVIGHDCRNNSRLFSEVSANIFSANGIKVYLFEDLRPTPEASFAIRQLGCQSGIILTASHNPKEYNGYKAYWNDGAQMIAPHDENVITEVMKIKSIDEIKFEGNPALIEIIGEEIDKIYIENIKDDGRLLTDRHLVDLCQYLTTKNTHPFLGYGFRGKVIREEIEENQHRSGSQRRNVPLYVANRYPHRLC